jgi:inner membrane protein
MGRTDLRWDLIVAAVVIGNLADIDTSYSHIGRLFYPVSRLIEQRFGHRTITHSLLALTTVTLLAYLVTDAWGWVASFYTAHLILDMIVGGDAGVPLLWPAPWRFYYFEIKPGKIGEQVIVLVLSLAVAFPLTQAIPDPAGWLHQTTGRLDYALQDFRAWEPWYHVYADLEATDQRTHRPVSGTFEIVSAQGSSLVLRDVEKCLLPALCGEMR